MKIEQPRRVRHTRTQRYRHPVDRVFPLLCPVREADWVSGWDPERVITVSGVVELGCLFVTRDAAGESTWVTVAHEPETGHVAFVKVTPGRVVAEIDIVVVAEGDGCRVEIQYTWTALGDAGASEVASRDEAFWRRFMDEWERALAEYLDGEGERE